MEPHAVDWRHAKRGHHHELRREQLRRGHFRRRPTHHPTCPEIFLLTPHQCHFSCPATGLYQTPKFSRKIRSTCLIIRVTEHGGLGCIPSPDNGVEVESAFTANPQSAILQGCNSVPFWLWRRTRNRP